MSAEYEGLLLLLLLIGAVVLGFVLEIREFLHMSAPAQGEETSGQEGDPRVFRRVKVIGGIVAFLVLAGVTAMNVFYPEFAHSRLAQNLVHSYALMIYGFIFFVVALLCGAKARQPLLLVCLTLPGLVVIPLVILGFLAPTALVFVSPFLLLLVFVIQPGLWVLLCIAIGQAQLLRKPGGNFTLSGLARIFIIAIGYVLGMPVIPAPFWANGGW